MSKTRKKPYNYLARPSTALRPMSGNRAQALVAEETQAPELRVARFNVLQSNMGAVGSPRFVKEFFDSNPGVKPTHDGPMEEVGLTVKTLEYRGFYRE